jgi:hypothetical protein
MQLLLLLSLMPLLLLADCVAKRVGGKIGKRERDEGRGRLQGTRESLQGRVSGVVMAKLYSFIS